VHDNGCFFYGKNTGGLPMSLFRTLTEAALAADLNKNESKVFLALLNQTLGYGKSFDHLTDSRLAQLTSVRLDRFHTAVEGVVEKGLFNVEASNYYNYRYQIAEKFLDKHPVFFTPHLPKKGIDFRKSETISVFRNDPPKNGDIPNNTFTSFNQTKQQQPNPPHQQPATQQQAEISPPSPKDVVVDEVKNEMIDFRDNAEVDVVVFFVNFNDLKDSLLLIKG
jgi:phage replication O-like protein O